MIWRNLVLPGWGHLYANEWRGWVYGGLWISGAGLFTYALIDYLQKEQVYLNATDRLQTKLDSLNAAGQLCGYTLIGIGSIYIVSLVDSIFFSKIPGTISAFVLPENSDYNYKEGVYAQIAYQTKF